MTKHIVNITKLGLIRHQNASLIKKAYCNCETPILFQLFKQNLDLKMEKEKKDNERKEKEQ